MTLTMGYGKQETQNEKKKNVSSNSQKRFTFQVSKPTVEHNLDDIASNDTKMRLEIIFWGHKSFGFLCRDLKNETFS